MNQMGGVGREGEERKMRRVREHHAAKGQRDEGGGREKERRKWRRRGSLKSSNDLLIDEGPKL